MFPEVTARQIVALEVGGRQWNRMKKGRCPWRGSVHVMPSPSRSSSPRPAHLAWSRVSEQTSTLLQPASCNLDDCGQRLGSPLTFFDWSARLSLVGCLVVCSTLIERGHV